MKKLGHILLFILNVLIDTFLILLALLLILWIFFDIPPKETIQNSIIWVEKTWEDFTGKSPEERLEGLSKKQREKAHRELYVREKIKKGSREEERITQPYKYE